MTRPERDRINELELIVSDLRRENADLARRVADTQARLAAQDDEMLLLSQLYHLLNHCAFYDEATRQLVVDARLVCNIEPPRIRLRVQEMLFKLEARAFRPAPQHKQA